MAALSLVRGLRVAEVFGPVWQGEGPATGQRAVFLRLGLCNLSCSWCDTPFTWDWANYDKDTEAPERDGDWLVGQLAHLDDGSVLVVTGGEPLMQQDSPILREAVAQWSGPVHVETNGTIHPRLPGVDLWVVSPKVAQDDNPRSKRIKPPVLTHYRDAKPNSVLKFVARSPEDVDAAAYVADGWESNRVWIMPEGVEPDDVLATARLIAPAVTERGYNLSLRQHSLLYGTERRR